MTPLVPFLWNGHLPGNECFFGGDGQGWLTLVVIQVGEISNESKSIILKDKCQTWLCCCEYGNNIKLQNVQEQMQTCQPLLFWSNHYSFIPA